MSARDDYPWDSVTHDLYACMCDEIDQLRSEDDLANDEGLGRTFDVRNPCPQCGRDSVIGMLLVDDEGRHQHTWYACTSWQGHRCGWTGWTVDDSPVLKSWVRSELLRIHGAGQR